MRRFFLLATLLLILGLWIPLLAATARAQKEVCKENTSVVHLPESFSPVLSSPQAESVQEQLFPQLQDSEKKDQPKAQQIPAVQTAAKQEMAAPENTLKKQQVSPENEVKQPEGKISPPPLKEPESPEEPSADSFTFNFLYYLFYKFDISQFFKTTGLN